MSDHHINGPSRLNRRAQCPASMRMEQRYADNDSHEASRGRLQHRAVYDDSAYAELSEVERAAVDECRAVLGRYQIDGCWHFEERLELPDIEPGNPPLTFGTPDAWATLAQQGDEAPGDNLVLLDWKFGQMPVKPPADSWQMKAYAVMLCEAHTPDTIQMVVVQPALASTECHTADCWQLNDYHNGLLNIIEDAEASSWIFHDGPECQFCSARHACPVMNDTPLLLDGPNPVTEVTVESAAKVLRMVKNTEAACKVLRSMVAALFDDTDDVPGLRRIEKSGRRSVSDPTQALQALLPYIPGDTFEERAEAFMAACCSTSVTNLEAFGARLLKRAKEVATIPLGKAKVRDMITFDTGKPTISIETTEDDQ